jgi:hypothetical protein
MDKPFESIQDLVRKMDGVPDFDLTGEFHPDPEEVEAWRIPLSQEDTGEFRYANKSPMELRRMIAAETDPVEKAQMEKIMDIFVRKGWAINEDDAKPTRAGEPYRGEPKPDVRFQSARAMGEAVKPVSHVFYGGEGRGIPDLAKSGEGLGMVEGAGGVWEEQ